MHVLTGFDIAKPGLKTKKAFFHAHWHSLEHRARNVHDQNELTIRVTCVCKSKFKTVSHFYVFALKCRNTNCCYKAIQSFSHFLCKLTPCMCDFKYAQKLNRKALSMLAKSNKLVASKQTIIMSIW